MPLSKSIQAPLSVTAEKDNMRFIMNQAEVSVVVCSADMVQPLLNLAAECPTLKSIIAMEPGVGVCMQDVFFSKPTLL